MSCSINKIQLQSVQPVRRHATAMVQRQPGLYFLEMTCVFKSIIKVQMEVESAAQGESILARQKERKSSNALSEENEY